MTTTATSKIIRAYFQKGSPTRFFSSMFKSPPQNFHDTQKVQLDVTRSGEDVAIAVTDIATGYRLNANDIYTNKEFLPPVFKEAVIINAISLLERFAGQNPHDDPIYRSNLIMKALDGMEKVQDKIRRAIELQASQVMQTGTTTFINADGDTLFSLDYKPKSSHFPTSGTAWGQVGADPFGDIRSLSEQIRADGLSNPDLLTFGEDAFVEFMKDSNVIQHFDTRRADLGSILASPINGAGAVRQGVVQIGSYQYEIWTYPGRYKHIDTGVSTAYLAPEKVVVSSSDARMDATFGNIPNIGKLLGNQAMNMIPGLPERFTNADGGVDLHANAWLTPDGDNITVGVGSRPLMIPTAIDTYGCLDTGL